MDGNETPFHDCWYLTGPTASGKTEIGVSLAETLNAEIISMDSMTLYREMDIGTAKPSAEQRARVPHHLVDALAPTQSFSVSNYLESARRIVAEIRGRSRTVLFVGGTPLYLKALLRGLFQGPPADWSFRSQIEAELQQVGIQALHERLRLVDPLSAERLHPHDKRRIIRALEVYRSTGKPISHLQIQFDEPAAADDCHVFALQWPREVLHRRIQDRVDEMFRAGFVDEVRGLLTRHGSLSLTASQAVGYREVIEHLQRERSLRETMAAVKARTRRFARRQGTWFRSLAECRFVRMDNGIDAARVVEQILESGGGSSSPG